MLARSLARPWLCRRIDNSMIGTNIRSTEEAEKKNEYGIKQKKKEEKKKKERESVREKFYYHRLSVCSLARVHQERRRAAREREREKEIKITLWYADVLDKYREDRVRRLNICAMPCTDWEHCELNGSRKYRDELRPRLHFWSHTGPDSSRVFARYLSRWFLFVCWYDTSNYYLDWPGLSSCSSSSSFSFSSPSSVRLSLLSQVRSVDQFTRVRLN